MITTIIVLVIAVPVGWLAMVLIKFNRKRLHIIRSAEAATPEQLEAVYSNIEKLGTEQPSCAVLARTNRRANDDVRCIVPVPSYIQPWAGRAVAITIEAAVGFQFISVTSTEPVFCGKIYRAVAIPRLSTKTGKSRNQFAPSKYLTANPALLDALKVICPYPAELLSYLLASGGETFEFDPINQLRIGGSPSWVQGDAFPDCDDCKKRMSLIVQLPGTILHDKKWSEETFYFFGCSKHPDITKMVSQLS